MAYGIGVEGTSSSDGLNVDPSLSNNLFDINLATDITDVTTSWSSGINVGVKFSYEW